MAAAEACTVRTQCKKICTTLCLALSWNTRTNKSDMQWPIINAPRQHRSLIQSARPLYATLHLGQRPQPRSRRRAHVVRPQQWPTVGWPPMECWIESLPLPPPRLSREETQRLILLTVPVTHEQATQKASRQLWRGTTSLGTGSLPTLVSLKPLTAWDCQ